SLARRSMANGSISLSGECRVVCMCRSNCIIRFLSSIADCRFEIADLRLQSAISNLPSEIDLALHLFHGPMEHSKITHVAVLADETHAHRRLDGTAVLMRVRAIRVAAQVDEGAELDEKAFHLFWNDIPQFEL